MEGRAWHGPSTAPAEYRCAPTVLRQQHGTETVGNPAATGLPSGGRAGPRPGGGPALRPRRWRVCGRCGGPDSGSPALGRPHEEGPTVAAAIAPPVAGHLVTWPDLHDARTSGTAEGEELGAADLPDTRTEALRTERRSEHGDPLRRRLENGPRVCGASGLPPPHRSISARSGTRSQGPTRRADPERGTSAGEDQTRARCGLDGGRAGATRAGADGDTGGSVSDRR